MLMYWLLEPAQQDWVQHTGKRKAYKISLHVVFIISPVSYIFVSCKPLILEITLVNVLLEGHNEA